MTATSIGRIVVPGLALVAASGAALVFGIMHATREPPVEARTENTAPVVSPPASAAQEGVSAALATAQGEANAVAAAPAPSSDTDESVPVFDVARIERSGDAVIAGRAAPGATVELLRGGERLDQAVADQSGQFVMVPPRLPAGDYELTLRSRQPDGKQAVSKHSVVVALANGPETMVANGSAPDQTVRSSQAHQSPEPPLQAAKQQDVAGLQLPHTASATPQSDADSASAVAAPKLATRVVSRGDSLWRISHVTYGAGLRYVVVYKANRDQIRNPNRIYPGQIFVLPAKER